MGAVLLAIHILAQSWRGVARLSEVQADVFKLEDFVCCRIQSLSAVGQPHISSRLYLEFSVMSAPTFACPFEKNHIERMMMLSAEKMIRCQLQDDGLDDGLDDSGVRTRSLWLDTDHMHLRSGSSRLTVPIVPPLLPFPIVS
ncbi:hypothetical protein IQ07DRAFT_133529 [Pyrenochaeta sp. DS3sAY3a]|nr:hypothetical protein IQ07DRAFT_133529 [Pyrenochaeta sp. DS3sAY3a]